MHQELGEAHSSALAKTKKGTELIPVTAKAGDLETERRHKRLPLH
eukprot:SAG31_NODE_45489_length_258_cov_1.289308_1_plen_44_part_10